MTRSGSVGLLLVLVVQTAACSSGGPAVPAADVPSATSGAIASPVSVGAGPELLIPAPATRPAQPPISARYSTPLAADHCVDRDLAAPPVADPALAVLDRSYALAPDDVPPDLVEASAAGLDGASGTRLVRDVVVADLGAMRAAWQAAGLTLIVESAYRSYQDQAATFDGWAARIGHDEALLRAARPGHSEHQLGTAIDVTSPGWSGRFGDWAVEAIEGAWMAAHAWEYGFVMSYPAGGQDDSCYGYEPWHYRWIGREAAAEHRRSGLVLRRFLERYLAS
jgi:D-alanyl-D-alanine carboxypeptidase